ncbi:hypothetical protein PENSPDRAFT_648044 [Peniophora sp. CONT]|nr:hypothetical protein PENSPDRAFT_648044 [Peniophora sp. CONT]
MFSRVKGMFSGGIDDPTVINVKWNRERLVVQLKNGLRVPLSELRATLAERTSLAPNSFKLIHKGAVLKDDSALLSAYSIAPGATLQLLESNAAPSAPAPKAPKTEESTIAQIRAELAQVQSNLQPGVDAFLASLSSPTSATTTSSAAAPQPIATVTSAPAPAETPPVLQGAKTLNEQHAKLGELLLQALLRLDAINIESGWPDARAERKGAVKNVQGILDRVDGAWRDAKAKGAA